MAKAKMKFEEGLARAVGVVDETPGGAAHLDEGVLHVAGDDEDPRGVLEEKFVLFPQLGSKEGTAMGVVPVEVDHHGDTEPHRDGADGGTRVPELGENDVDAVMIKESPEGVEDGRLVAFLRGDEAMVEELGKELAEFRADRVS